MEDKLNIVLFHAGKYDDCNWHKHCLFEKCYKSVEREFKNDNIIIYHSVEQVFYDYPSIKEDCNNFNFFSHLPENDPIKFDVLRIYLTKYITNMLYLDSDIVVYNGFREDIIKYNNENTQDIFIPKCLDFYGLYILFSKKYNKDFINHFYQLFINDEYKNDLQGLMHNDFYKSNFIKWMPFDTLRYDHYHSLETIRHDLKHIFLVDEFCRDDAEYKLLPDDDLAIFLKGDFCTYANRFGFDDFYFFKEGITVTDILQEFLSKDAIIIHINSLREYFT